MRRYIFILVVSLFGQFSINAYAQVTIKFDTVNWILDENARIETFRGKEALRGTAFLKDIKMENGTIEVDVFSTGERNFGGFIFHAQSTDNYEWCWLRIHKTNGFIQDAVQYAPIYNGTSCWQLYGGKNGIAAVNLPKNKWIHLKLDIQNDTARLFVDDMSKSVLIMDNLQPDMKSGMIGIKGLWHDGLYFTNFSYQQREHIVNYKQTETKFEKNLITDWILSQRYQIDKFSETESYPDEKLKDTIDWISPRINSNGLVNITRYYSHKQGNKKSCAILKTVLESNENKKAILTFGYSDAVTIYINGQPIFSGNSSYRSRNMAFGGWISYNDKIYIDLHDGDNELIVVVAEDFGGWGFQAKIIEAD